MKNLKYAAIFSITFVVVFIALIFGLKTDTKTAVNEKKAPNFTITTFEGKKITLSELDKNKVIVVNFWASWCGPCREEAPDLEKVWRKYKKEIIFVGLNWNDKPKNAKAFIKEFDITYPNGPVEDKIASQYGLTGVPETFVIKNGLIKKHFIGVASAEDLGQSIENEM